MSTLLSRLSVWCGRGVMEIESALVGGRLVVGGVQEATLGCMLGHSMQEAQQAARAGCGSKNMEDPTMQAGSK